MGNHNGVAVAVAVHPLNSKIMETVQSFLYSDVLFDVLVRIPVKDLLGLKSISTQWQNVISSRSFIKAQMENIELSLTGFILQENFRWCNEDIKTVNYLPVETTIKGGDKMQHQSVFHFLPEDVVVLASCKGLVCCRSCFPCEEPTIYVCNPSNKQYIKLDLNGYEKNESIALAFDLDSSFDTFTKFKLVRVKQIVIEDEDGDDNMHFEFELYSSETGAWWKSNETCQCDGNFIKNKGIYIGGVLHWLTDGDQVVTFDVEKELSWLISAPVPAFQFESFPEACIGESNGKLHYVLISEEGLHVWHLEDYYESKWTLKQCKPLEEIEAENPKLFFNLKNRVLERVDRELSPWMNPLGFKDGLLLLKVCADLFLYDIENNKMTLVCTLQDLDTNSMSYPTVLPHCLSLVPLRHA
ncbi:hypothetical protein RIF29_35254 [Crotalaria pallida]|uniref:F-box protein At3g26010-like beta-propeller domain-containing protein n=1 Tax=Crotalaria pallida TaxID=3830 RepID=A0AAN9HRM0_CROPI